MCLSPPYHPSPAVDAQLDEVGLSLLKNSISAIETRGELVMQSFVDKWKSSVQRVARCFI